MLTTIMLIAIVITIWYVIGIASIIYDITSDSDFKMKDIPIVLFIGLIGPITIILIVISRIDFSKLNVKINKFEDTIIMKKR